MPDERREGTKKGAGRPKGSKNKLPKEQRKLHQLRAHDEEWALINDFARQIKHGNKALCESFLNDLKIGAIFVDTTSNFEKIWMENDGFTTNSEMGSVKVGNDKFATLIRNRYGDGITKVAVVNGKAHLDVKYFETSLEGEFNIYSSDCGNKVVCTLNGRYGVYSNDGYVVFEKWSDLK